ncbi:hypothetical protein ACET3Z_025719 [Daucus carota]
MHSSLAAFLALDGAQNYKQMVIMAEPFGRVFELWSLDMGLGSVELRYIAIHEADLNAEVVIEADEVPKVADEQAVEEDKVQVEV